MKWWFFRNIFQDDSYICVDWIYARIPDFDKRRLCEWSKKWLLRPIKRWWYIFGDTMQSQELWFHLAHVIYKPSYISLYTALAWYGCIPETVVTIQSISPLKTAIFHTQQASWSYTSCQSRAYQWYQIVQSAAWPFIIATLEKAIVDVLYYQKDLATYDDFDSLRLYKDNIREQCTVDRFRRTALVYNNKTLMKRVETFILYIWRDNL